VRVGESDLPRTVEGHLAVEPRDQDGSVGLFETNGAQLPDSVVSAWVDVRLSGEDISETILHDCTRVTLTMDGFDPNGAIMQDGLTDILTTESHIYPSGDNAVRQLCTIGFKKTDGSILISWFDSKMTFNGSRKITLPNPHFVTTTNRQMKDDSCKEDHIVQREIAIARPAPNIKSAI
jgi:hypothetical protein